MTAPNLEEKKLPRYVELIRVSSAGQGDRDTPEIQRVALGKLREIRPGILIETISDGAAGLSGALGFSERPDLQKLATLAKARAFDELRCYDIDRLTRAADPRERFAVYGIVADAGAIIVDRDGRETNPSDDSGMGELDFYLKTLFASRERKKITERTTGGRKRTAAAGKKPSGGTPYGFVYDKQTKVWSIHEERSEVIRSMFRMAAEGISIPRITKHLTESGIPSPSGAAKWHHSVVQEMLRNPLYEGKQIYTFKSERFTCAVPRIVPENLWSTVQAGLTRRNNVPVRSEYKHPALLRMRAVCGDCGAAIYVDSCSAHQRYQCGARKRGKPCPSQNHPLPAVDDALWLAVSTALRDPKWVERLIERQRSKAGKGEWAAQAKACEGKLDAIRKKEAAVPRMLGDGISEDACREQLQTLARQRQTVQRSLETAQKGQAASDHDRAAAASLEAQVARLRPLLDATDYPTRERLIAAVTPEDGILATLHHGTIDLRGILNGDGYFPDAEPHGKPTALAGYAGRFAQSPEGEPLPLSFRLTAHYALT